MNYTSVLAHSLRLYREPARWPVAPESGPWLALEEDPWHYLRLRPRVICSGRELTTSGRRYHEPWTSWNYLASRKINTTEPREDVVANPCWKSTPKILLIDSMVYVGCLTNLHPITDLTPHSSHISLKILSQPSLASVTQGNLKTKTCRAWGRGEAR